ncbi:LLM class flavin-dependent oxidoreductase [Rhodococcus sp. NPDC019627]|uniref:LLM class flavin-dependent oxidoreductase n=1 Tax=unclassified Rhodococcus (in: high G+C Gram-positive bacteria) TaxID=192944 RepID=UPI0034072AE4
MRRPASEPSGTKQSRTLTYAAAVTEHVRLGTSVLVAPYRHPLLIGKMLATLDVLSGGRVDAGFGTGWLESEYRALGLDARGYTPNL